MEQLRHAGAAYHAVCHPDFCRDSDCDNCGSCVGGDAEGQRMKRSKNDVEKLKLDILDTAEAIFLKKNYSEVNVREITE